MPWKRSSGDIDSPCNMHTQTRHETVNTVTTETLHTTLLNENEWNNVIRDESI